MTDETPHSPSAPKPAQSQDAPASREAAVADQLERVVRLLREVFGEEIIGAYLHGSAVLAGLRRDSDVDILAVCRQPTTPEVRRPLIQGLLEISAGWPPVFPSRSLELTLVASSELQPWRYPPAVELQFGEWHREKMQQGLEPWARHDPDLAPQIAIAVQGNRPLFGPPPADVFPPIPRADLLDAMAGSLDLLLPGLLADDTRFAVLTFTRIWFTVSTGQFVNKDIAADWALPRLPPEHQPVLRRARAAYLGEEPERWDDLRPHLQPFADHLIAEIKHALASASREAK